MNLIDVGTKLQELKMTVDEDMMVHFALNSLPKEFKPLKETYIAQKENWTLNDLITIYVQQEHNIIREMGAKWSTWFKLSRTRKISIGLQLEKSKKVSHKRI